jgi:hypothetical protein
MDIIGCTFLTRAPWLWFSMTVWESADMLVFWLHSSATSGGRISVWMVGIVYASVWRCLVCPASEGFLPSDHYGWVGMTSEIHDKRGEGGIRNHQTSCSQEPYFSFSIQYRYFPRSFIQELDDSARFKFFQQILWFVGIHDWAPTRTTVSIMGWSICLLGVQLGLASSTRCGNLTSLFDIHLVSCCSATILFQAPLDIILPIVYGENRQEV